MSSAIVDSNPGVRLESIRQISNGKYQRYKNELISCLKAKEENIRLEARTALETVFGWQLLDDTEVFATLTTTNDLEQKKESGDANREINNYMSWH